jgi:late competence protein required for DNA uptake (superfamily II DNA/RNA helicase)
MGIKLVNLKLALPRCRHCQSYWQPDEGVSATITYCPSCSEFRRAEAAQRLGFKPIQSADENDLYLLPRALRSA